MTPAGLEKEVARLKTELTAARQALNERNENTKVWIQSDTQTRKYACELERLRDSLAAQLRDAKYDNGVLRLSITEMQDIAGRIPKAKAFEESAYLAGLISGLCLKALGPRNHPPVIDVVRQLVEAHQWVSEAALKGDGSTTECEMAAISQEILSDLTGPLVDLGVM